MGMIELLQKEYYSKADVFLLPLTGIKRQEDVKIESFLFWREYSIEDYKLTVTIENSEYTSQFLKDLTTSFICSGNVFTTILEIFIL